MCIFNCSLNLQVEHIQNSTSCLVTMDPLLEFPHFSSQCLVPAKYHLPGICTLLSYNSSFKSQLRDKSCTGTLLNVHTKLYLCYETSGSLKSWLCWRQRTSFLSMFQEFKNEKSWHLRHTFRLVWSLLNPPITEAEMPTRYVKLHGHSEHGWS